MLAYYPYDITLIVCQVKKTRKFALDRKGLAKNGLSLIFHQYQRGRGTTEEGHIIASEEDYHIVYSLSDAFAHSLLEVSAPVLSFLEMLRNNANWTRADAQRSLKVSDKTIRRYIDQAAKAGFLETSGRGTEQAFKVIEIPKTRTVLPPPEKIFSFPGIQMSSGNR
jgi:hypothetical protein